MVSLQEYIESLDLALSFLNNSIDSNTNGSRAYYSRTIHPINGWSGVYTETSGYILNTLIDCSNIVKSNSIDTLNVEKNMADWLVSIQHVDGAFHPGIYHHSNISKKSVFNTAQVLLGLNDAFIQFGNSKYKSASELSANWLIQQYKSNRWINDENYLPSYYSRVSMALAVSNKMDSSPAKIDVVHDSLSEIAKAIESNGFINRANFSKRQVTFLHSFVYVVEGYLYSYMITGFPKYLELAKRSVDFLLGIYGKKKALPASFTSSSSMTFWYRCITGEIQFAIILQELFTITGESIYRSVASDIIDEIYRIQIKKDTVLYKAGGLLGSYPSYGDYNPFRQLNWATKFYIDAVLKIKIIPNSSTEYKNRIVLQRPYCAM